MMNKNAEQAITRILMIGAPFITIFVTTGMVTDPVNVTKQLALGAVAFAIGAVALVVGYKKLWESFRLAVISAGFFVLFMVWSVANSDSPLVQNIYGVYGRNTGFLTYLSLVLLFLACLLIKERKNFDYLLKGLLAAGVVNVIYCLWATTFGDFIGWNNPYGNILGTFGNPNFIGAFLGIFISVCAAYVIAPQTKNLYRILGLVFIFVGMYEIKESHAVQGVVVGAGGLALVLFFYLRSRFGTWLVPAIYSLGVSVVGVVAVFGALQKGPLAEIVYKTSVSLRGEYWSAGINMASNRPFTGVGMDSYGDWFRRERRPSAMILPGPDTITNAAHSVPFDILAFGGWPLFISYLAILALAGIAIVKVLIRQKQFDVVFVGLAVGWVCYQVQSIISINQIGLAIWGWILSGAVIAYEMSTRLEVVGDVVAPSGGVKGRVTAKRQKEAVVSAGLVAGIGAVVGLLLTVPPFNADAKWRAALSSSNVQKIEEALIPSYMTPMDSNRLASAVQLLEQNKLTDLAYKYAEIGIEFNPESFDAWKVFYYTTLSTPEDKAKAKAEMIRLDPLNEAWKKLP